MVLGANKWPVFAWKAREGFVCWFPSNLGNLLIDQSGHDGICLKYDT